MNRAIAIYALLLFYTGTTQPRIQPLHKLAQSTLEKLAKNKKQSQEAVFIRIFRKQKSDATDILTDKQQELLTKILAHCNIEEIIKANIAKLDLSLLPTTCNKNHASYPHSIQPIILQKMPEDTVLQFLQKLNIPNTYLNKIKIYYADIKQPCTAESDILVPIDFSKLPEKTQQALITTMVYRIVHDYESKEREVINSIQLSQNEKKYKEYKQFTTYATHALAFLDMGPTYIEAMKKQIKSDEFIHLCQLAIILKRVKTDGYTYNPFSLENNLPLFLPRK